MKKQDAESPKRHLVTNDIGKRDLVKIGERLKHYRKQAGYNSYEFFAYEHGFSRPQYGKYEAGANITITTLSKILKALNVSYEDFFKGFDSVA
jgi:transcriptional regulator with XRE-family HTH domain